MCNQGRGTPDKDIIWCPTLRDMSIYMDTLSLVALALCLSPSCLFLLMNSIHVPGEFSPSSMMPSSLIFFRDTLTGFVYPHA